MIVDLDCNAGRRLAPVIWFCCTGCERKIMAEVTGPLAKAPDDKGKQWCPWCKEWKTVRPVQQNIVLGQTGDTTNK